MKTFVVLLMALVAFASTTYAESPDWEHSVLSVTDKAFTVAASPDGKLLAVACTPKSMNEAWRIALVRTSDHSVESELPGILGSHQSQTLRFSGDSRILFVPNLLGNDMVVAWDIKNKEPMATVGRIPFSGSSETVAVNHPEPNSTAPLLVVESEPNFIRLYDESGQPLGDPIPMKFLGGLAATSPVSYTAFSPTGDYCVITCTLSTSLPGDYRGYLRLVSWSYMEGKWNFCLEPSQKPFRLPAMVWDVAVSPDGKTVAVATPKGIVLLTIDLVKKGIGKQSLLKGDDILEVAFMPDGRLVTAGMELAVHNLKGKTRMSLASFDKPSTGITRLTVRTDGSAIYGLVDQKVHVWKRTAVGTSAAEGP